LNASAEDRWLRLHSEHFEVLTAAGAANGREVLRRFEQIRHVFETRTNRSNLTPLPVRVFVFRGESEFERFQVNRGIAGYYQPGTDRDYIAMQVSGADTYRVVYHEYTHLLLRHAGYRVPVWFNEGIAELFSTADVGKSEVRVGDLIPSHVATLRNQRLLEIPTLGAVDQDSPFYNERGKSGIFYAQSWALVHMLNFAPEYRTGVANFVELILAGEDTVGAFRQAYGKTPAAVGQDLKSYLDGGRFEGLRFRTTKFDVGGLTAEPLRAVTARLALADLLSSINKLDEARLEYRRLEASSPDDIEVLVALGQFAVRSDDFAGARLYLERAFQAGRPTAGVYYDYAVVLRRLNEPEAVVISNLEQAVRLDDRQFDAHSYLGYLHLQGERFDAAVRHFKRASELQPRRVSVWENLAVAHHRAGQKDQARAAARMARRSAIGPEEVARIDALLDFIESDADKIVVAPQIKHRENAVATPATLQLEGFLTQVDCLGRRARLHVVTSTGKVLLLVRDPGAVQLSGAISAQTAFACGPSNARPVVVSYRPETHRTYGTSGVVQSLRF
jgi:Flp pilus assembly protein TadD